MLRSVSRKLSTSKDISFRGKTAIITGAGGALGKAYALDLAKRGCNLLLNDLGTTLSGEAAKATVSNVELLAIEIAALGSCRVEVNLDSVQNGEKIVEQAMNKFQRVDIVINNAGNLRDKSFTKMEKEDWNAVLNVHLNGTFSLCHAVWPVFNERKYGRIINIGSGAGLYGNFGQANYSSAKMGILGLTQTLAKEGAKNGILVNCVVPVAHSRMTETVLSPEILQELRPEHVSPIVSFLASERCTTSGACFEVGGGWYSQVRLQRSAGVSLGSNQTFASAEAIEERWQDIVNFDSPTYPSSAADAMQAIALSRAAPQPAAAAQTTTSAGSATSATPSVANPKAYSLSADAFFGKINFALKSDPARALEVASKVKANVLLKIRHDSEAGVEKLYLLKFHPAAPVCITEEASEATLPVIPATTLSGTDTTFCKMFEGSMNPEFAYMFGKLSIAGHMGVALKIKNVLEFSQSLDH